MAPHCGFELIFMPVERRAGKLNKLLIYLVNAWKTLQILRTKRPEVVWIQLPQVPLMWVALFYRRFFNRRALVIADCHNKMFRTPWSKVPFGISMLSDCDLVLVHNEDIAVIAVSMGVNRSSLLVVEDPPSNLFAAHRFAGADDMKRPWLVFPASFAEDEPIRELMQAAKESPEVSFLVTGDLKNCKEPELISGAPTNVRFMGYLSREDYEALILECDAVVAFTRFDGIQLSVCGEAVGAKKPMLISDTATLRRLFPIGSVFVRSDDSSEIALGVKLLMARLPELRELAKENQQESTARWINLRGRHLREFISTAFSAR